MKNAISTREREKYDEIWALPQYREYSPGQKWIPTFLSLAGDTHTRTVVSLLDIGCGTGRAGQSLEREGFHVSYHDLTFAALEHDVPAARRLEGPLWRLSAAQPFDVGYCCDVMEHVPREFTMLAIDRILTTCRQVFFSIATEPDVFGARIGQPLHLTVEPFVWWRDRLRELGTVLDARDCFQTSIFWVTRDV